MSRLFGLTRMTSLLGSWEASIWTVGVRFRKIEKEPGVECREVEGERWVFWRKRGKCGEEFEVETGEEGLWIGPAAVVGGGGEEEDCSSEQLLLRSID